MPDYDGTIELETPGKTYRLKCTPRAMMTLFGTQYGGASGLIDQLRVLNVEAMVAVIVAGAGVKTQHAPQVWQHVFDAGPGNIVVPIIEYIVLLNNGGRAPDPAEDAEPGNG